MFSLEFAKPSFWTGNRLIKVGKLWGRPAAAAAAAAAAVAAADVAADDAHASTDNQS